MSMFKQILKRKIIWLGGVTILGLLMLVIFLYNFNRSKNISGQNSEQKPEVKNEQPAEMGNENNFGVNLLSPTEFKKKVEEGGYVIVDIRTPREYQEGHIKGAINLDFLQPDFKEQVAKMDRNKKYLYYCLSGCRSQRAEKLARELGFKEVYELRGGLNAWKEAGYSLVTGQENDKVGNQSEQKENTNKVTWYHPRPGITWQWQLDGPINTSYNVNLYDIDLFDTPQSVIDSLHKRGIKVICYFSAGTWEKWRPDAGQFPKDVIGRKLEDWPGERWLNIAQFQKFAPIILRRMDLAVKKKCDGIEPDNIDGYTNKTGFKITAQDQLRYNKWLAREAHKRGLAIALKNDIEQVGQLVNDFDFAINEQCFEYNECAPLQAFIRQNKAVLGVEYELKKKKFCPQANAMKFSWLKMDYDLKGGRDSCR